MAKKKKWIQAASASIKKRGTEGVCTGPKFGGPTCPPGSKRYNLAKVFKGMAKKKKKAAWGSMIHAKDSKYIQRAKDRHPPWDYPSYDLADKKDKGKSITKKKDDSWKYKTGPVRIDKRFMFDKRFLKQDPRMMRQGGMLKAKTSAFAETHAANWAKRRGAATTGMKVAGAGTAYTSPGWTTKINKSLNKLKTMMKLGTKTTSLAAASKFKGANPSKFLSRAKTLSTGLGKRSLALAGGPIGLGMYAGTMGAKHLVTKAFDPYRDKATGKISKAGHKALEASARKREKLAASRRAKRRWDPIANVKGIKTGGGIMAKTNKARTAKTGTMVRAAQGIEVLGKQQVPFKIEPASANLAEQRQGRKGAAVTGFDFKGVR